MWHALDLACSSVSPGGRLFIALYNDQGARSRIWGVVKRTYVTGPEWARPLLVGLAGVAIYAKPLVQAIVVGQPLSFLRSWRGPRGRGMSRRHDLVDWVGGFPFEVSRPDEVFQFCRERGFRLDRLRTAGIGHGCNEFVFTEVKSALTARPHASATTS
jgi:2-polyprenyl-6-hydroxyphenyl methylase/3-demethylubiquinone-9 3-methyltransferase